MTEYDAGGWMLLERARERAEAGERVALATVVWRESPSSGRAGSRAIVTADGRLEGWIGGACAEPVVLRKARHVIESGEPRLLYLGAREPAALPDGAVYVTMSCQSDGALQIFIEPVLPAPHLVVVGRTPMVQALVTMAATIGWRARALDGVSRDPEPLARRSVVVVATQGHGDEDAVRWALEAVPRPAYVGLVASRKRGEAVLGYLADRGIDRDLLATVHTPVGLDLGHTTHTEIAVSVLAELVRLRAAGELVPTGETDERPSDAVDPVCHMTVPADDDHWPLEHDSSTYFFCGPGCRDRFAADPSAYLQEARH